MLLIDKESREWYIIYANGCINLCIKHLKVRKIDCYSAVYSALLFRENVQTVAQEDKR